MVKGKEKDKMRARIESLGGFKDEYYPLFIQSNIDYIISLIDGKAREYKPQDSKFDISKADKKIK